MEHYQIYLEIDLKDGFSAEMKSLTDAEMQDESKLKFELCIVLWATLNFVYLFCDYVVAITAFTTGLTMHAAAHKINALDSGD